MTTTTHQPRREILDGPIRDVLIDLAHGHRQVPHLSFAALQDGTWHRFSLAGYSGTLSLSASTLRLLIDAKDRVFGDLYDMMGVRNQPMTLILQDGASVQAEFAHMERLGDHAHISLFKWSLTTDATPVVWAGRLHGKLPSFGNLSLIERGDGWLVSKADGFRFSGRYHWYILPQAEHNSALVVVDPAGAVVDRAGMNGDLLALQFTLGGTIQLDYLVGCDHSNKVAGALSLGSLQRAHSNYRPPVAHRFAEAQVWLPEFFRLLASKIKEEGVEPLIIAITAYLDAESDHLDGAYLKAQVGLEAFARRIHHDTSPALWVNDGADWKRWISTLDSTVRSHLRDPAHIEGVRNKLISAMYAPSGDVVRSAFDTRGIVLPNYVRDEIRKRGYPIHGFLMNQSIEHDFDKDVRRLELIQTVLVALVATYIGYGGPIHGYDVDSDGGRLAPEWWPLLARREDISVLHLAERHVAGPHPEPGGASRTEFALLMKVAAGDAEHFRELKARAMSALSPHVLSLDPVDLEFAAAARDADFMALAVEQARLSKSEAGRNSPKVGAVVVVRDEIVAMAHRGELGPGDHAEYTALERKLQGVDLSGATVFTTLEPCTERNPPKTACVDWIIRRKIGRVVIGTLDPNPKIKGEGVIRLREAGISVQLTTPSLTAEIEQLNAAFSQEHRTK